MGMYTGIRCKVKLKSEFVNSIQKLIDTENWSSLGHDLFEEYSLYPSASSIPFGSLAYMDMWKREVEMKE
ncbi:hypothetical protein PaeCFBP13512_18390 [Paenibacillus sp. CFBP13512]|nr:hypothetical protein [Paenibacillus sp. CFBP13512]TKJ87192.1 hypothetical protein PaeCFBP13512_18390 [Paenibacillus sp. CFBP13512]